MFDKYKNANSNTFNGAQMLADMSGLSVAEIAWTFNRMKELRQQGETKDSSLAIVKEECKLQPWLTGNK